MLRRLGWRRLNSTRLRAYSAGRRVVPVLADTMPMTREEIAAMFTRREAHWRNRDAAALAADHAPDSVVISPTGGVLEGRDEIQRVYNLWVTAFSDLTMTPSDLLVDGDRAVLISSINGTHAGAFFGMPASGRRVQVVCASLYTFREREIVHERRILDFTGVLIQVGVLKAKPAGGL
jgi:uncharacterized protein (TIGR02246 family)